MIQPDTYFPFWNSLTKEQQEILKSAASEQQFKKGTLIHGGASDCVGLLTVESGQLRVYTISQEGKELTLYRLLERDMCLFSASCIMNNISFDVFVSAEQDTTVLHIPAEVYKRLMETSLTVSNYTNQLMASHFSEVMWLMDQILNKKLDSRLAALLVEERELSGSDRLLLTHEQLGNHLGTVREVVTRMLKHFQDEGLVKLARGSVCLTDLPRLYSLAKDSLK